jgi:hypothetical protein
MPLTVEDIPNDRELIQIQKKSSAKIRSDSISISQKKVYFTLLLLKIKHSALKPQEPVCTKSSLPKT